MLQFKHPSDISQLSPSDPAHPVTQDLISRLITPLTSPSGHYDNDAYGWIVLIQEGDLERPLTDVWPDGEWTLLDIPWEGILLRDGFFQAIYLANNDFGLVFIIPDAEWLSQSVREMLEKHLDP
ncbi:hypothetical protein [Solemya velum gill symbiont]|uniref:Uncharacterized protein n=1 Tax=Solemya velum gill symbiont TaxID=2340 RepID=A0A0B0HBM5_SOVGS|nr:hypothetical protein [Solemya velum gill symbiont]KHF25274.1 hypothetical protein JV46_10550 [Solemya velum gill symbiont]OOY35180.1 hypothetical protein BOV88_06615 [Solemya velum gill symbiont]OOY37804.1 hypothetical protein BOV89_05095 [Solemya velum gill symbiont]OOY41099.1 hypothetical protein BOV90_00435 [Solemya velum gill symbiont]OOY43901.1 hypothetical protein BOV92_10070 [Solemya velum gill symbiont]